VKHRHAATAYANALFAAAKEWNQTEVVSRELDELGETFVESNPEAARGLRPAVGSAGGEAGAGYRARPAIGPHSRRSPRKRRRKRKRLMKSR
jgi:hypothetical protein